MPEAVAGTFEQLRVAVNVHTGVCRKAYEIFVCFESNKELESALSSVYSSWTAVAKQINSLVPLITIDGPVHWKYILHLYNLSRTAYNFYCDINDTLPVELRVSHNFGSLIDNSVHQFLREVRERHVVADGDGASLNDPAQANSLARQQAIDDVASKLAEQDVLRRMKPGHTGPFSREELAAAIARAQDHVHGVQPRNPDAHDTSSLDEILNPGSLPLSSIVRREKTVPPCLKVNSPS